MPIVACIPAYNEENSIRKTIYEVSQFVDKVVVCDDGSNDKTSSVAESAGAFVIKHSKNQGKGAAMKSLFEFAKSASFDVMITIDADGQFLPEEIPKLTKPILENKSDVVIGYRFDDTTEMPGYRKFGNKMLDKMTNLASDLPFKDTQSGFRAYSREAIEKIQFKTDGFGADSEILVDAAKKRLKISEEKATVIYNTGERTSTKNPISHTGEVIVSLIELIAIRSPLKALGIPGIILVFIGIYFSTITITLFNETRYFSIPNTLISLGTIIIGLMLVLMSVLLFSISKTKNNEN